VQSTVFGTPVAIYAGSGDDQIGFADDDRIFTLGAPVTLYGEGGTDTVTVFDDAYGAGGNYRVTSSTVSEGSNLVNYIDIEGLTVYAGQGNSTVTVDSTNSGTEVHLYGRGGDDTFWFNADDHVWSQFAPVYVDGEFGDDVMTVYDDNYAFGEQYHANSDYLDYDGLPTARISHTGIESVTLLTGGNADTIETYNNRADLGITVESNAGADLFRIGASAGLGTCGLVRARGGDGADEFRVAEAQWFDDLHTDVQGQDGTDQLWIFDNGSPVGRVVSVFSDQIMSPGVSGAWINYDTVESIQMEASNFDDVILIESSHIGTPVTVNGNGGNDRFEINPSTQIFFLESPVTVRGNAGGSNELIVHESAYSGSGLTYTLDATSISDGSSQVSFDGLQRVRLNAGSGGSTFNVQNTAANSVYRILAGDGQDQVNVWETHPAGPVTVDAGPSQFDTVNVNPDNTGFAEVHFDQFQDLSTWAIGGNGLVRFETGNAVLVVATGLNLHGSGTLDLSDGGMIEDYLDPPMGSSTLQLRGTQILNARNSVPGMPWQGQGITSSLAISDPSRYSVGFGESAQLFPSGGNFMGATIPVGMQAVLIRGTRAGDANLNGSVNNADFAIWNANKFTLVLPGTKADFNFDGAVDGSDFGIWNANRSPVVEGSIPGIPDRVVFWWDELKTMSTFPTSRANDLGASPFKGKWRPDLSTTDLVGAHEELLRHQAADLVFADRTERWK
jgi:hypothetical protein